MPAVIGEGYLGYTPLDARFEEGPIGKELCELALQWGAELGYWGAVVTSVAAPHHPMWSDVVFRSVSTHASWPIDTERRGSGQAMTATSGTGAGRNA